MSKIAFVNGNRDLGMCKEYPINQVVELVKRTKSGLIQVKDMKGKFFSLPQSNIDIYEICTCECHRENRNIMHCMPCCGLTYETYLYNDGTLMMDVMLDYIRNGYLKPLDNIKWN